MEFRVLRMIAFCSWMRWACWMAVSRRLRSASDFGFILRLVVRVSEGSASSVAVCEEVFLRIDFGWGCDVDMMKLCRWSSDVL